MVWPQVDAGYEQQGVVGVKLGELGVAPVELAHAGAVHQCDVAILPFRVPQLKERFGESEMKQRRDDVNDDVQAEQR